MKKRCAIVSSGHAPAKVRLLAGELRMFQHMCLFTQQSCTHHKIADPNKSNVDTLYASKYVQVGVARPGLDTAQYSKQTLLAVRLGALNLAPLACQDPILPQV